MGVSEYLRKTFADQKSRVNEAGQAVLEYILVLFVTVSIILGVMYQFSGAFQNFLDLYFGNYLACLIESGELPSFGGATGANQGSCAMPDFNFNSAQPLVASGTGGGATPGSGDSAGGGGSSGGDSRSSTNLRPSGVVSGGGSLNSDATRGRGANGRPASITQKARGNNGKASSSPFTASGSSGRRGQKRRGVRRRVVVLGSDYVDKEAVERKNPVVSKAKTEQDKAEKDDLRKPTMALKYKPPEPAKVKEESGGFSFGFLIKFLLIAGILVAIFIFLGGQAMQIKKSWQK